jgi:cytosolic iron-sulfur protein assembly protein CIAO1
MRCNTTCGGLGNTALNTAPYGVLLGPVPLWPANRGWAVRPDTGTHPREHASPPCTSRSGTVRNIPRIMATATGDTDIKLERLPDFKPRLFKRAWCSIPHPTLPLLATAHDKEVTVFSLATLSKHSALTGGHSRSVRSAAWKPGLPPHRLCVATGSFDSTAALWRWNGETEFEGQTAEDDGVANGAETGNVGGADVMEVEITGNDGGRGAGQSSKRAQMDDDSSASESGKDDWELDLVLEGHESEIKSVAFSPSGQYLATCSRDKSVWIWEDVGASDGDDDWETVAVLNEHDADVKAVAWCPDVPNRTGRGQYSADVLASASYDNTLRVWREDGDGEWVCVAVLEGHQGTIWGLQWEPASRPAGFPRILSFSADKTARIWTLQEDGEDDHPVHANHPIGAIPNRMRRSMREDWKCTALLPSAHTRDIYSASWSALSGRIATTGSDGKLVVYEEHTKSEELAPNADMEANHELDGDEHAVHAPNELHANGVTALAEQSTQWKLLTQITAAHGAYEVNHVVWCKRYDREASEKGVEEMLVTSGDDGFVRPWRIGV